MLPAQAAGRPTPIGVTRVKVATAGPDQVRVTWTGGSRTTKYAVAAGSTSMTDKNHWSTRWYAASSSAARHRSITVTVPRSTRAVLGGGSGNVVFVKLLQTNSTAANPPKCIRWSPATLCRASASGTAALAGRTVPPASVTRVSVASWNVQSIDATRNSHSLRNRWASRVQRITANVEKTKPDLVGFQELGTARITKSCKNTNPGFLTTAGVGHCTEQYENLQSALSKAATVYRPAASGDSRPWKWVYGGANRYVDSQLFFNPKKMTVVHVGIIDRGADLRVGRAMASGMWAVFTLTNTNTRFVAASIHLQVGTSKAATASRQKAARNLSKFLDAKAAKYGAAGTPLPIVLVGDLNGNGATDSKAGSLVLRKAGWFDSAAVGGRGGARYSTSNATNGTDGADAGYPVHAVIHRYPTSRIDYILTKNSPYSYGAANLIRLKGKTFDTRYNGSDHNLQFATVGIAAPSAAS